MTSFADAVLIFAITFGLLLVVDLMISITSYLLRFRNA